MADKSLWEVKPVTLLPKEENYRPASTSSILRLRCLTPFLLKWIHSVIFLIEQRRGGVLPRVQARVTALCWCRYPSARWEIKRETVLIQENAKQWPRHFKNYFACLCLSPCRWWKWCAEIWTGPWIIGKVRVGNEEVMTTYILLIFSACF